MRSIKAALVEVMLRRIKYIVHRDRAALHRRPTAMSQSSRCVNLMVVGQKWNHSSPSTFRHSETVQQHQGRLTGRHSQSLARSAPQP
jgi:hypothetical protein